MSRHTRLLRKQARAQAAARGASHQTPNQPAETAFGSGATAVLDRLSSDPHRGSHGLSLDELELGEMDLDKLDLDAGWAGIEEDEPAVADEVQAREARSPDTRPPQPASDTGGRAAAGPVVPLAKASRPEGTVAPRRVIPGREPAVETPPEQRPQPLNEGWLWRDKIRMGDLVVLVGDEGSGKTRVLTDWIARVTSGRAFPGADDPSHALPPSDVLVFNCVDDFAFSVLDQVELHGGDRDRVLHASTQLLDWGHSHGEFPEGAWPPPGLATDELPEPRVRLHTQEILRKLAHFLKRRPSIRMVVIDQLKQHLRTDSERVFEDLIFELQVLGRQTDAVFVLTQRPDAFRNATGIKQYFKSDSLTGVARSIWRVAQPEDPQHGHRVLQCLKLNYGCHNAGRAPWRLWQETGQPMRWEQGNGLEFRLGKLDAKDRLLFHAKTFISLYLRMFGGLADFETLRICARREGITGSKLMEASLVYDFGYEFEGSPDEERGVRKVVGEWADIRKRQAIPEPERPPVIGPPLPKQRRKKPAPLAAQPLNVRPVVPAAAPPANPVVNPAGNSAASPVAAPRPTPEQHLESLRARVARGEARLKEFDLQGFRFIKPNLATCHLLLTLEAELGSEEQVLAFLHEGLTDSDRYSTDEITTCLVEYRRLLQIGKQIAAETVG